MSGLVDSLPTIDPKARFLAYNNTLDRLRVELPPLGDAAASGIVQTWDIDSRERAAGNLYSISHNWEDTVVGEEKGFLICGREHGSYNRIMLTTSGDWKYEIWETPTVVASGSQIPKYNFRRDIGSASGMMFVDYYADPTVSASGVDRIYESRTGSSFLSAMHKDKFWVLDRSTDYYIYLKNYGVGPNASGVAINIEARPT